MNNIDPQTIEANQHENIEEKQLSVDVYQDSDSLVIISPVAGAKLSDISITITDDVITIRGSRKHEEGEIKNNDYYAQECYWGSFSRSIILPKNLKTDEVNASFKNGILKIEIPKSEKAKTKVVRIDPVASQPFLEQ